MLSQYIPRDVLGQYIPPDQWAHGYMMVNISMLHNGNEEILSEGGNNNNIKYSLYRKI